MNGNSKYEKRKETTEIIIHCTATKPKNKVTPEQIKEWHLERGFLGCGYHLVVDLDGTITCTRPLLCVGAHCKGHNHNSIGIAYIGGLSDKDGNPMDTRTDEQMTSIKCLIYALTQIFDIKNVWGHNHYANVDCPCFDAHAEYQEIINSMKK